MDAEFAKLDAELEELQGRLKQQLDERGEAMNRRVEELLATAAPAVKAATAAASSAAPRPVPGGQGRSIPDLARIAVCGIGGPEAEGVGQRLLGLLGAAAITPAGTPRWLDLEEAPNLGFEELDARFFGAQAVVICPDLTSEHRRDAERARAGLRAVLGSLPVNLRRCVLLSSVGAQSGKGGINLRAAFGLGYEAAATALEDELTASARRRGNANPLYVTIVRVGELQAAPGGPGRVCCLPGDSSSSAPTSLETATEALFQTLALKVDTTFCVVEEPGAAAEGPDWEELLLPYRGPELWRVGASDALRARRFVQAWARDSFGTADERGNHKDTLRWGLKTPVMLRNTAEGVRFKFRPLGTQEAREFEDLEKGGLEFTAEAMPGGGARLRVQRCNYGWKVVLKENSERAILRKFQEDWARL